MKKIALALFALVLSVPAFAWNCTTPGQIRVQVPTGTVGNGTGDGSGQVVVDSGLTFECETLPTTSTTPTTSNSTSTATSAANSNATGGNASSTATGGNVKNTNTLTNTQGQKQGQTQSNSSVNSNQSSGGSVSDVGNSQTTVEAPKIPVNTAVAPPVFSTTNCFKGFSAGGQTAVGGLSFGGGGIDKNCTAERVAQDYFAMGNRLAACKVITSTKASKDAGVTLADCMNVPVPVVRTVVPVVSAPIPAPVTVQITNNIPPAPAPIILHEEMTVTAPRPQAKKRVVHRPCSVTPIQNACPAGPQEK
jgi:hypothetical protein